MTLTVCWPSGAAQPVTSVMSVVQVDDCPVQPSYNYPTETKRIYCRTHKKDGEVPLPAHPNQWQAYSARSCICQTI